MYSESGVLGASPLPRALLQDHRGQSIIPDRSRRIAGVARAGAIVAREKFFADVQFVAHAFGLGVVALVTVFVTARDCEAWADLFA